MRIIVIPSRRTKTQGEGRVSLGVEGVVPFVEILGTGRMSALTEILIKIRSLVEEEVVKLTLVEAGVGGARLMMMVGVEAMQLK